MNRIKIDKEVCIVVDSNLSGSYGLPSVVLEDSREYTLATREEAENIVHSYWMDMALNDTKEFIAMVGEQRLIQWALGRCDEYGIRSLDEFCEVSSRNYEETLATYDNEECNVDRIGKLRYTLELMKHKNLKAYRTN